MRPLSNFAARDVEALLHPTTNLASHRTSGPLILDRAEGIYVFDTAGRRTSRAWRAFGAPALATATPS